MEQRWISVTEQMPPVETEVLITARRRYTSGTYKEIVTTAMYEDGTVLENDSCWNWYEIDGKWDEENECYIIPEGWWENRYYNPDDVYNNLVDDEVIAWMPLPEPYHGEQLKQTNADRIRSMTDEELADFLVTVETFGYHDQSIYEWLGRKVRKKMENRYMFRAKRIDTGEWVEGYLSYPFCTEKGNESYYFYAKDSLDFYCRCVVDAATICQCTGLEDMNGKLIWEKDIVNCMDAECCGYIGWNESEAGFYFNALLEDGRFEEEHIYDYQDCMEVIGNSFDNPELLEGNND